MDNKIDIKVGEFLKDLLETGVASIQKFEEKLPELKFDGVNATAWQFIVLKSLDPEFPHFQPLAHHLLDHNYCLVEGPMVKYAALNGYKFESSLSNLQKPLDSINSFTADCGFSEKLIVTNKPVEAIINIAKKIVSHANDTDYNEVKDIFEKSGVDIRQSKIMNRPVTKTLKVS